MMPIFDSEMYAEAYSSLHASGDTLARVMEKAAGARKGKRRVLPAFAALLALTVSVIVFAGGGVSRGAWSFRGTMKDMEKMGFFCPEQLGEYQVDRQSVERFHVVNAKAGALKACLKPDYVWMSVTYEKNSGQALSVSFGSMDDPLWAYVSQYDVENDVWEALSHPETGMCENEEEGRFTYIDNVTEYRYRNCRVYLYDEVTEYTVGTNDKADTNDKVNTTDSIDATDITDMADITDKADTTDTAVDLSACRDACAVWTDQYSGLWFSVHSFRILHETDGEDHDMENGETEGRSQEEMLGYVKKIIDGCR